MRRLLEVAAPVGCAGYSLTRRTTGSGMGRVWKACALLLLLGASPGRSQAPPPPTACQGTETYRFEVQGSIDGGGTWSSNGATVYGRPGNQINVMARARMTTISGQTEGWSYSLEYDDSSILYYSGSMTITAVTTNGTQTATVKNGGPPDTNKTAIRAGYKGYTQGVLIDTNSVITLNPTSNFVTSKACYRITMPSYSGTYQVHLKFTHKVGSPKIESVISQDHRH